jgi:NADH:ubiquinone oxidoreductase subunit F (NADH-binding)
VKWNFLAGAPEGRDRYLVCNADEGDPGGWVNRVLLEGDPHLILEGMLIAAFATGAHYGYIYIRNEYPLAVERMRRAIADAEAAGILGPQVLGSDFACTFAVAQGAGAYVCGDETGLIASLQDGRGMPRIKPPFPANAGVLLQPSNVNNVETYANVPLILQHGPAWYRQYGTQADPGTKIFSFSGNIARAGFMELPFGTPLRAVLEACGGVVGGELKAIQPGGPLIGYLPASVLDRLTLERAPFSAQGAGLGGGGIVFVGPDNCSVDLNVLFAEFVEEESCGRCTTCHHGNQRMHEIFQRISDGRGRAEDRHALELVGETLQFSNCAHGQLSPTIMRNTLRHFQAEYDAHIAGNCEALRCAGLTRFRVVDQSDPRLADAQTICPTEAIVGGPGERRVLDERCIRCGACTDLAPRGIAREAAPVGTALPPRRPADPPGMPAAAGFVPLAWQGTALARPEGGHGGPAPSPVTLFV